MRLRDEEEDEREMDLGRYIFMLLFSVFTNFVIVFTQYQSPSHNIGINSSFWANDQGWCDYREGRKFQVTFHLAFWYPLFLSCSLKFWFVFFLSLKFPYLLASTYVFFNQIRISIRMNYVYSNSFFFSLQGPFTLSFMFFRLNHTKNKTKIYKSSLSLLQ